MIQFPLKDKVLPPEVIVPFELMVTVPDTVVVAEMVRVVAIVPPIAKVYIQL